MVVPTRRAPLHNHTVKHQYIYRPYAEIASTTYDRAVIWKSPHDVAKPGNINRLAIHFRTLSQAYIGTEGVRAEDFETVHVQNWGRVHCA